MDKNWLKIWNNKFAENEQSISLEDLISLDGFDQGAGTYNIGSWRKMVSHFYETSFLKKDDLVLELGCGCGAFLFALNELANAEMYGIDYSSSLINTAKKVLPNGNFITQEANLPAFDDIKFDIIFSHSVFQYFPNFKYAKEVIGLWVSRLNSGGTLILMDLNDSEKEEIYHEERMVSYESKQKYKEAYDGLEHLFINKNVITEYLEQIGMTEIEFFPHAVTSYKNSKYRFNLKCIKA